MLPAGVATSRATLDALATSRPVIVRSSFGHTVLANSRALALARITRDTPDPLGGKIAHDAAGEPTGILEDAAFEVFDTLVPKPTPAQDVAAARAALAALARQGVTTFLDAAASAESMAAFHAVQHGGGLTARAHFAPPILPPEAGHLDAAIARIVAFRKRYDQGPIVAAPRLTVRNAKLFLDGVIAGPSFTGAMLEPYLVNAGTEAEPRWQAGPSRGPDVYFPAPALKAALIGLGRAGIDPHMHADGDRAVHEALDAIEALRSALPGKDIRPAIAHDEIVSPDDFARYARLKAFAVLSLQWGKPASDTVDGLRDYLGPARARILEPSGLLAAQGAAIAFGSDWPVDPLDEWFALKVGVTRTNAADCRPAIRRAPRRGPRPHAAAGAARDHHRGRPRTARGRRDRFARDRQVRRPHRARSRPVHDPGRGDRRDPGPADRGRRPPGLRRAGFRQVAGRATAGRRAGGSGAARGEQLRPVDRARAARRDAVRHAHLREARVHDVGAVARAREPAGDNLGGSGHSRGDVLADDAGRVAATAHAIGRQAAVGVLVREIVARTHRRRVVGRDASTAAPTAPAASRPDRAWRRSVAARRARR